MSLVYPALPRDIILDRPALHALIVGVADYPHLSGGTGSPHPDKPFGLKQVSSPLPSALLIADWLAYEYNQPQVPLGSIELVTAPGASWTRPDGSVVHLPGHARLTDIKRAVYDWKNRCDAWKENAAFFYFCGHGLSNPTQFLLPQDYADPSDPDLWSNCIDFERFRANFNNTCKADTQLFFVDACRNRPAALTRDNVARGTEIVNADEFDPPQTLVRFYATSTEGVVPDGRRGAPTCFAEAFVKAMRGGAAERTGKFWSVTTDSLGNAVKRITEQLARRDSLGVQIPDPWAGGATKVLHQLDHPVIFTRIDCETPVARADSQIALVQLVQPRPLPLKSNGVCPWYNDVLLGDWELTAEFPSLAPYKDHVPIDRPYFDETIKR